VHYGMTGRGREEGEKTVFYRKGGNSKLKRRNQLFSIFEERGLPGKKEREREGRSYRRFPKKIEF